MILSYKQVTSVLGIIGIIACATKRVEKEIEQQVAAHPTPVIHTELVEKELQAIETPTTLTPQQKQQLQNLQQRMIADAFRNQEETSKLKRVLFETIVTSPYDRRKVTIVKKKLKKLNDEKMSNMFSTLREAERLLGDSPEIEKRNIYTKLLKESPRGDTY